MAVSWFLAAGLVALIGASSSTFQWPRAGVLLGCSGIFLTCTFAGWLTYRWRRRSLSWLAMYLERYYPDLDSRLLTAAGELPNEQGRYDFLQQEVIRSVVYHDVRNSWVSVVPRWQTFGSTLLSTGSLVTAVAILGFLFLFVRGPERNNDQFHFSDVVVEQVPLEFEVEPGDCEVETGKSLLVLARFSGRVPTNVVLDVAGLDGGLEDGNYRTLEMARSLDDPVFAARIENVGGDLQYRVRLDSNTSENFSSYNFRIPQAATG